MHVGFMPGDRKMNGEVSGARWMSNAITCTDLRKRYDSGKNAVDAVNGLDLALASSSACFGQ